MRVLGAVAVCGLALCSCNKAEDTNKSVPAATSASPGTASAAGDPAADKAAAAEPVWYKTAPKVGTSVKPGDRVWGFHQFALDPNKPVMTVVDVISVDGERAEVRPTGTGVAADIAWKTIEAKGDKTSKVPLGFLRKARTVSEVSPKAGDIVVAKPIGDMKPVVVRVKAVEGELVSFDMPTALGDATQEKKTDYIEPLAKGLQPFSLASCKVDGKELLTLVIADDDGKVFGVTRAAGKDIVSVPKADCEALDLVAKDWKVGDKVVAFPYGTKAETDKIEKVVLAKWAYTVGYSQATWDQVFAEK